MQSRRAKRSELELVHSPKLVDLLASVEAMNELQKHKLQEKYTSTYYNAHTNDAALLAAGCLLEV